MATEKLSEKPKEVEQLEVVRPPRAKLSPEEALKRMEQFTEKRKEKLIAAVRKGKS